MEVDPEEVKRHLEILGYKDVEPYLLNEFVEDLKKLIEYDRKHNYVSVLTPTTNIDSEQNYSERMKTSSTNKEVVDRSCQIASADQQESDLNKKQKPHSCTLTTSSATKSQHKNRLRKKNVECASIPKEPKCYLCEHQSKSMESQANLKMKRNPNQSQNIHISATLSIEL